MASLARPHRVSLHVRTLMTVIAIGRVSLSSKRYGRSSPNASSPQWSLNILYCLSFPVSRKITSDKVPKTRSSACAVNRIKGAMTTFIGWELCSKPPSANLQGMWRFLPPPYASLCISSLQSCCSAPDSFVRNINGNSKEWAQPRTTGVKGIFHPSKPKDYSALVGGCLWKEHYVDSIKQLNLLLLYCD